MRKNDVFAALLTKSSVFVHFDPTKTECIPQNLKSRNQVVFQFGYDLAIAIPDLSFNDYSVSGTLSFGGKPFFVEVPWTAAYAVVGEDLKGMVYESDMPQSVFNEWMQQNASAKLKPIEQPESSKSSEPVTMGKVLPFRRPEPKAIRRSK